MKSVLFVQNGDFAAAYDRFADTGAETYRDQRKSVGFVASLAPEARVTTAALGPRAYHRELAPNLWSVGWERSAFGPAEIARLFDAAGPSHLVLRFPHLGVLAEARRREVHVLPSFADVFSRSGFRRAVYNFRLRRAITGCRAPCLSNHSLNASRSAVSILRMPPGRVVPWDWSPVPPGGAAKSGPIDPARPAVFFAGALSEPKGVGDCLEALAALKASGLAASMSFAGQGDIERWQARAKGLGIADRVTFLGMVPNDEVRRQMRAHDMIVVPSRHDYAEGLPNTIYEALASRSALIVSDHPAFAGRLVAGEEALVFPAGDARALADRIRSAATDPGLYARLSGNAAAAHDKLYVGMEWSNSVEAFLDDPEDRSGWVAANSLAALDRPETR